MEVSELNEIMDIDKLGLNPTMAEEDLQQILRLRSLSTKDQRKIIPQTFWNLFLDACKYHCKLQLELLEVSFL